MLNSLIVRHYGNYIFGLCRSPRNTRIKFFEESFRGLVRFIIKDKNYGKFSLDKCLIDNFYVGRT